MTSYEKKQRIINIYKEMTDSIEAIARDMIDDPAGYIPREYLEKTEVSKDVKAFAKEVAWMILDEIRQKTEEIYRL